MNKFTMIMLTCTLNSIINSIKAILQLLNLSLEYIHVITVSKSGNLKK